MGADLHRPQPHQARQGCLNRLSFMKTAEPQTYVDRLLADCVAPRNRLRTFPALTPDPLCNRGH